MSLLHIYAYRKNANSGSMEVELSKNIYKFVLYCNLVRQRSVTVKIKIPVFTDFTLQLTDLFYQWQAIICQFQSCE